MKKILLLILCLSFVCPTVYANDKAITNYKIFKYICEERKIHLVHSGEDVSTPVKNTMENIVRNMYVAESVINSVYNGDEAKTVKFYDRDGILRECYFTYKSMNRANLFSYDDLDKGSLFYISADKNGLVKSYGILSVIKDGVITVDSTFSNANFNLKTKQYFSYIKDIRSRNGKTVVTLGDGNTISVGDSATMYTCDKSGKNMRIFADGFDNGSVITRPEYDESLNKTMVSPVIAMEYNGGIVAICGFGFPIYVDGNIE